MAKNKEEKYLVIVESPAKAKTIKKILGSNYEIKASIGHVRDLPANKIGVNVRKNFEPAYEILPDKVKVVEELNNAAKKADIIYLAPDPDREGEAIAWHVCSLLDVNEDKIKRIEFNEITKTGILNALKSPRDIDIKRVNAQQARRVLDRLVGYKISPLLWHKIRKGLSAGRVQSVAVRLICEREREIQQFNPVEYWSVIALLHKAKSSKTFEGLLHSYQGKRVATSAAHIEKGDRIIITEADSQEIITKCQNQEFVIKKVTKKKVVRKSQPPFITSTLQRDSSTKYGFSVNKTMQVAQQLYEGLAISGDHIGLITYMRTDSTRISEEAVTEAKEYITQHYGKGYYPETPNIYTPKKSKQNIQDAHEAIRPTYISKTPESLKQYLTQDQYKIYKLVWSRFIASQMEAAEFESTTADIEVDDCLFKARGSRLVFHGFLIVYDDREDEEEGKLPELEKDETLTLQSIDKKQHFTQPPPRYTEASLVKTLEELGIGRPSTYAPTITNIQNRKYIEREDKQLVPTDLGFTVTDMLTKHFQDIVDVNFTAEMEEKLDKVEEDTTPWQDLIHEFYEPFKATLKEAQTSMEKIVVLSEYNCEKCGKPLAIKTNRWGKEFLACTGYPECSNTKQLTVTGEIAPEDKITDEACEQCGKPMAVKTNRWGSHFLACTGYPECSNAKPYNDPNAEGAESTLTGEKCSECGSDMIYKMGRYGKYIGCSNTNCKAKKKIETKVGVQCQMEGCDGDIVEKKSRYGKLFYACNQYPKCNYALWNKPTGEKCPECSSLLVAKYLKRGNKLECSSKECAYSRPLAEGEAVPVGE